MAEKNMSGFVTNQLCKAWHNDIQHNDTQHIDTQDNATLHNNK